MACRIIETCTGELWTPFEAYGKQQYDSKNHRDLYGGIVDTVREFILRLRGTSPESSKLGWRHRRVVLPVAAMFGLEGTVLRTHPIEPIKAIERPGGHIEGSQLLERLDASDGGDGVDARENDLGVDLAAILGLACGRRVAFANEFPTKYAGVDWTVFLAVGHMFDGELYGPVEVDVRARVVNILRALVALPKKQALSLGNAIRMRNAACCLVESDHSSAYGLLVAGIETLSRVFESPPHSWENWDQAEGWDKFVVDKRLTGEQAESLRKRLLDNQQIRLKRMFIEYVLANLTDSFWQAPYFSYTPGIEVNATGAWPLPGSWNDLGPTSNFVPTDLAVLRKRLSKSYDARSGVFHASIRLDQVSIIAFPSSADQMLPFRGLRRVLDHLLQLEVAKGAEGAPDLPDVKLFHPTAESGDVDSGDEERSPKV